MSARSFKKFAFVLFCFVLFCYITNHLMTDPLGNSEFCFPRISLLRNLLFPSGSFIKCLLSCGNNYDPKSAYVLNMLSAHGIELFFDTSHAYTAYFFNTFVISVNLSEQTVYFSILKCVFFFFLFLTTLLRLQFYSTAVSMRQS